MTKSAPDSPSSSSSELKGVQLRHLPNLEEIPRTALDDPLRKLLEKAVAIQLKAVNSNVSISQFAFENLIILVEQMLSNMLVDLHKMVNIQRRHCISKKDLLLIIDGYNLTCADLMVELERSQYVRSHNLERVRKVREESEVVEAKEKTPLSEKELLESKHPEFFIQDKEILTLVPPTPKNTKYVPRWLPEFPPDHTYRFTSQFNRPITDERLMKRKLAEEADLSEKALIHLSKLSHEESPSEGADSDEIFKESQQDTQLIFGPAKKKKIAAINGASDLLRTLPQQNYNVEEYARNRVEIARRKVEEYERHQLLLQKGAFIKAAHLLSPFAKKRNCKQVEKEVRTLLHRSYIGLLKSAPLLREQRKREVELAEENRRLREEQIRQEREERLKNSKDYDVLDLDNLNEDPFFGGLGSSDTEDEKEPPQQEDTNKSGNTAPSATPEISDRANTMSANIPGRSVLDEAESQDLTREADMEFDSEKNKDDTSNDYSFQTAGNPRLSPGGPSSALHDFTSTPPALPSSDNGEIHEETPSTSAPQVPDNGEQQRQKAPEASVNVNDASAEPQEPRTN